MTILINNATILDAAKRLGLFKTVELNLHISEEKKMKTVKTQVIFHVTCYQKKTHKKTYEYYRKKADTLTDITCVAILPSK